MTKKILAALLAAAVIAALPIQTAYADESSASEDSVISYDLQADVENPPKTWQITLEATVVSNQGDSLVVYLGSPGNMAVENGDTATNLQVIPIAQDTTAVDKAGESIDLSSVLPGQKVSATFWYHFISTSPNRTAVMDKLLSVALTEDALVRQSSASISDFDSNVMVATILSASAGQLEVYVEVGRAFQGQDEYLATGLHRVTVPQSARITGANGASINFNQLQQFQRVALTVSDAVWQSSWPPRYVPESVSSIQVLGTGQQIIAPAELAAKDQMTGRVLSVGQDENGNRQFVVQPAEGTRERALAEQFTVTQNFDVLLDSGDSIFSQVTAGSTVSLHYTGLRYGSNRGQVLSYHNLQILS